MNTREALKQFIETELIVTETISLGYDDDLIMNGLINSLGVMRLVAFMEETFSVKVPPQDITIDHFANIDAIASYIEA